MFDTPILFLIFNRPDTTELVFEEIRKLRPKQLFIAADGPRADIEGEKERCCKCRSVIQQIDWNCKIETLFRDNNLGCGRSVSSAITWFFEHVEEGIILEDDCLPHPDFFQYCSQLLDVYRNNDAIKLIGGTSFLDNTKKVESSYYFSKHVNIWGWASWRRVWKSYDFSMENTSKAELHRTLTREFTNPKERDYWRNIFGEMQKKMIDTWDYQLHYTIWKESGVCIHPVYNLVSNIGFREDATHTRNSANELANRSTFSLLPLTHPTALAVVDKEIDRYIFENYYNTGCPFYKKGALGAICKMLYRGFKK